MHLIFVYFVKQEVFKELLLILERAALPLFWSKSKWNNLQFFLCNWNLGRCIYNILIRNDAGIILCILIASKFS